MKAKKVYESLEFKRRQSPKEAIGLGDGRWPYLEEFKKEALRRGYVEKEDALDPKYYETFLEDINVLNYKHPTGVFIDIYYNVKTPHKLMAYIEEPDAPGEGIIHDLGHVMKFKNEQWKRDLFWEEGYPDNKLKNYES